jgi:uncharacterized protein (UPF0548 family)
MSLWRFGRSWPEETMKQYLSDLAARPVNFDVAVDQMTEEHGWTVDGAEEMLGYEAPGPPVPDGVFERARQGLINYDFSDPRIVEGHFDPACDFIGREMLLEIKAFGLHYLGGVRVHSVRNDQDGRQSVFGFRYDTLQGHIERGYEWFLLTKNHETGEVRCKIEAHWLLGDFPNWWSRLGFKLIGERFRTRWRHNAPERLRELVKKPIEKPVAVPGGLAHRGDPKPEPTEPARNQPAGTQPRATA